MSMHFWRFFHFFEIFWIFWVNWTIERSPVLKKKFKKISGASCSRTLHSWNATTPYHICLKLLIIASHLCWPRWNADLNTSRPTQFSLEADFGLFEFDNTFRLWNNNNDNCLWWSQIVGLSTTRRKTWKWGNFVETGGGALYYTIFLCYLDLEIYHRVLTVQMEQAQTSVELQMEEVSLIGLSAFKLNCNRRIL